MHQVGIKKPLSARPRLPPKPTHTWPSNPYENAASLCEQNSFIRAITKSKHKNTINPIAISIASAPDAKIHSFNANGIRARIKDGAFVRYLIRENPDAVFLQEFRCTADIFFAKRDVKETLQKLGHKVTIINSCQYNIGYAGTAIITRLTIYDYAFLQNDNEGRIIRANFGRFFAINVYTPNSGRPGELAAMPKRGAFEKRLKATVIELQRYKPTIVIGDLNVAPRRQDRHERWDEKYWTTHPSSTPEEISMFHELCTARRHTGGTQC